MAWRSFIAKKHNSGSMTCGLHIGKAPPQKEHHRLGPYMTGLRFRTLSKISILYTPMSTTPLYAKLSVCRPLSNLVDFKASASRAYWKISLASAITLSGLEIGSLRRPGSIYPGTSAQAVFECLWFFLAKRELREGCPG